jgi:trk system potassium uptake protein TrkA
MKKQFAVIGVDTFGRRMIEELSVLDCEILIIDKDPLVIEALKDQVDGAYVADVQDREVIEKIIPRELDAAVVDLGHSLEASVLVTNYLSKWGIRRIITRASTDAHGEILKIVGATDVVFPSQEAARRITPLIAAPLLLSYLTLSPRFILAELKVPLRLVGRSLREADLEKDGIMNVIACREGGEGDYLFSSPDRILQEGDILLVAGSHEDVQTFSDTPLPVMKSESPSRDILARLFRKKSSRS